MSWIYLVLAAMCEIGWALGLKTTEGFTRLIPSLLTLAAMILSIWLLALAARSLPISTAYALWTGIGTFGAALGGVVLFKETLALPQIVCLVFICSGVIGLKLFSAD